MKAKTKIVLGLIIALTMILCNVPVFAQTTNSALTMTDAQPTSDTQPMAERPFEVGKLDKAELIATIGDAVSFTFEINDPNAVAEDTYTVSFEDKAAEGVTPFDVSKIITAPATITGNDKKVTVTIPAELTKDIVAEEQHSLTYTVTKNGAEAVTVETPVKITFIVENVNSQDSDLTADNAADDAATMSDTSVVYSTHVQNIGWQSNVRNGQTAGTTGKAYRLEAMKIKLENQTVTGNIEYRTHIQNIGWESSWKRNGAVSGTSNRSLRLEAMQVRLTGSIANQYDVYYRVHAQNYGWLNWAKNGQESGTAGFSYRLESMQIMLVRKGGSQPSVQPKTNDDRAYIVKGDENIHIGNRIAYQTHVQNIGWQPYMVDGVTAGTSGKGYRLEALRIKLNRPAYSGSIEYRTHIQNIGWESSWKSNGAMSGTSGKSYRLEAMQIRLTGEMANRYDVYYRVHAQNYGWMGWAKNGGEAGTEKFGYRLEAMQIVLVNKGQSLPSYSPASNRSEPFIRKTKDIAISMARAQGYDQIHEGTLNFCTTPAQMRSLFASEPGMEWHANLPDSEYNGLSLPANLRKSQYILPFPMLRLDRETTVMSSAATSRPKISAYRKKFLYFPDNKESWRSYHDKRIVVAYHSANSLIHPGHRIPGDAPYVHGAVVIWVD